MLWPIAFLYYTLPYSSYRWASLLWAMVMLSLSLTLAAVWPSVASLLASSSTACPSPFCSTSFLTTMPNWRNRNTHFLTVSALSSSRNVWSEGLGAALNDSQRTLMMRYTIAPVEDKLSTWARIERSCLVATLLTSKGLITHGSTKCKTSSASKSEPSWFQINNLREAMEAATTWDKLCCLHAMMTHLSNGQHVPTAQLVICSQLAVTDFDQTERDIWPKEKKVECYTDHFWTTFIGSAINEI